MNFLTFKIIGYALFTFLFAKEGPLSLDKTYHLPVTEMSGICLRGNEIVVISDNNNLLQFFNFKALEKLTSKSVDISSLKGAPALLKGQWESIFCSEDGKIFLLQESPPRILVLSKDLSKVESINNFNFSQKMLKSSNWEADENSKGEGLILFGEGRLLLAKEKNPAQLIEFSFENKSGAFKRINKNFSLLANQPLKAIRHWSVPIKFLKKIEDISEIHHGLDGSLYLLSDQSRSIIKLGKLNPTGGELEVTKIWKLPKIIKKPEGFFIDPFGRAVIVIDSKKLRKKGNLFITTPLKHQ